MIDYDLLNRTGEIIRGKRDPNFSPLIGGVAKSNSRDPRIYQIPVDDDFNPQIPACLEDFQVCYSEDLKFYFYRINYRQHQHIFGDMEIFQWYTSKKIPIDQGTHKSGVGYMKNSGFETSRFPKIQNFINGIESKRELFTSIGADIVSNMDKNGIIIHFNFPNGKQWFEQAEFIEFYDEFLRSVWIVPTPNKSGFCFSQEVYDSFPSGSNKTILSSNIDNIPDQSLDQLHRVQCFKDINTALNVFYGISILKRSLGYLAGSFVSVIPDGKDIPAEELVQFCMNTTGEDGEKSSPDSKKIAKKEKNKEKSLNLSIKNSSFLNVIIEASEKVSHASEFHIISRQEIDRKRKISFQASGIQKSQLVKIYDKHIKIASNINTEVESSRWGVRSLKQDLSIENAILHLFCLEKNDKKIDILKRFSIEIHKMTFGIPIISKDNDMMGFARLVIEQTIKKMQSICYKTEAKFVYSEFKQLFFHTRYLLQIIENEKADKKLSVLLPPFAGDNMLDKKNLGDSFSCSWKCGFFMGVLIPFVQNNDKSFLGNTLGNIEYKAKDFDSMLKNFHTALISHYSQHTTHGHLNRLEDWISLSQEMKNLSKKNYRVNEFVLGLMTGFMHHQEERILRNKTDKEKNSSKKDSSN